MTATGVRKPLPKGVQIDPIDRWGTRLAVEMTYGFEGLVLLDNRKCPSCKQDIPNHIGVGIEAKEYSFSGLCPKCQRSVFKPLENEAGEPDWVPPDPEDDTHGGRF